MFWLFKTFVGFLCNIGMIDIFFSHVEESSVHVCKISKDLGTPCFL